jgi:putative ABC transport system permease protein
VINAAMAARFWPNEDPVGKRIRPAFSRTDVPWAVDAPSRWLTIVGVAADVKEFRLNEQPRPLMYVSSRQFPSSYMFLMVRTIKAPASLAGAVHGAVRAVDGDLPVSNVRTMNDAIAEAVPRFNVQLLAIFAALAVLLSAVGVYGVTSYAVSQRTKEIGTRIALGASRADVVGMVVREGIAVGVVGVAAGVSTAYALTRVLSSVLYGMTPTDPQSFVFASVSMLLVAVAASYLPARRAATVDPLVALRSE